MRAILKRNCIFKVVGRKCPQILPLRRSGLFEKPIRTLIVLVGTTMLTHY